MGWTTMHRDRGQTNREFFQGEILGDTAEIVACSTIGGTFYAACRKPDGETFAAVVLTRIYRGEHNFGYKAMDETVGPYETDAPAKVLDALTPTDSQWANEWRTKCRERLAAKAAAGKVVQGARVRFAQPITFSNGATQQTFKFVKGSRFVGEDWTTYQITRWRDRAHEVLA